MTGRALCTQLLPELLTADHDGYPLAHGPAASATRVLPVPAELVAHARRAVGYCPRRALRLLPADSRATTAGKTTAR